MNKFLKLTGVSILAIVAAANANAAGYTCEELIEYTSCEAGYYISYRGETCPSGYTYRTDVGIETMDDRVWFNCEEDGDACDKIYGNLCVLDSVKEGDDVEGNDWYIQPIGSNGICNECPTGYTCDGGITQPYVGACEPGYTKQILCPVGYELYENVCTDGNMYWQEDSEESCGDYEWMTAACLESLGGDNVAEPLVAGPTCTQCPMGYLCEGGDKAATTCPAGSYCATAGLSTPTGLCAAGTYSTGGATSANCTTCPQLQYTNADGETVYVTATSPVGADAPNKCAIASGQMFTDEKGEYTFKESCYYVAPTTYNEACELNYESVCTEDNQYFCVESGDADECGCDSHQQEFIFNEETGEFYCETLPEYM
ncbi:MAG: hypothetical protein IKB10_01125 [Alphaproteobacteria bacterium]|nr:hypothetical protein [Alphaproteobacteria bacterium]